MPTYVKDAGIWKPATGVHVKDAGIWKPVSQAYAKDAGIWKPTLALPLSYEYLGTLTTEVTATVQNFGSISVPSAGRLLVGAIVRRGSGHVINAATIGGVAADIIHTAASDVGNTPSGGGFVALDVTAGSKSVVITFDDGPSNLAPSRGIASVWLLQNSPEAVVDSGSVQNASVNSLSLTLGSIPQAAFYLMGRGGDSTDGGVSVTNATKRFDAAVQSNSHRFGSADRLGEGSVEVTFTLAHNDPDDMYVMGISL